jgi:hypothetical protein
MVGQAFLGESILDRALGYDTMDVGILEYNTH